MTFQLVNYSRFNNFYENNFINHFLILSRDYKIVFEFKKACKTINSKKFLESTENSVPIGMSGPMGVIGPIGMSGSIEVIGPIGMSGPMGVTGPIGMSGPISNINNYWKNGFDSNFGIKISNVIEPFDNKFYNFNGNLNSNFSFFNYNNIINTDLNIISGPIGPTGPSGPSYNTIHLYNYHSQGVNGPNGPINNFNNKFSVN